MIADVLSDVLGAVRLTGAIYFDFSLTAPWVAEAPPSHEIAGIVMPGSERVIDTTLWCGRRLGTCYRCHADPAPGRRPARLTARRRACAVERAGHARGTDLAIYARTSTPLPLVYELAAAAGPHAHHLRIPGCDERPSTRS